MVGPVHVIFDLVLAHHVVPVILRLPGIHNAALRQVGGRTEAQVGAGIERDVRQRLVQLTHHWFGCAGYVAAAEFHIEAAERTASFIHDVGAQVVRPAYQHGLAQSGDVEEISSSPVIADVEEVAAVEDVTAGNGVTTELYIVPHYPVKEVLRLGYSAGNAPERSCRASTH